MASVLSEIRKIRNSEELDIDTQNSNRYCIVINEKSGEKTAYCFSAPIYNVTSRRLISRKFEPSSKGYIFNGTNSVVRASEGNVFMSSVHGDAELIFDTHNFSLNSKGELTAESLTVIPTFNGIRVNCQGKSKTTFKVVKDNSTYEKRSNKKYFAFMIDRAKPFLIINGLYAKDRKKENVYPVNIEFEEKDGEYIFCVSSSEGEGINFEVNMYEEKLIHDTTVETNNPDENNVYGGVAFIGKTKEFGEQWLYARPNFERIPEMCQHFISNVNLYVPQYNKGGSMLVYVPERRFCSFGSTWNNKIPIFEKIGQTKEAESYQVANITNAVTDEHSHKLLNKTGIVLRSESEACAIATADNYYTPQIMEIKYL